ncbi:glyoxylate/hydroxypyruvate reductase A [Halomonas sp. ZH2S]|uniref:Glyoxylate/hydroxypyruvate reductase A n=1 Tax=Vreelandella zhuhanensis TaxID=2684210 RepID=A0A7X3H3I4_9GAMM|nr:glyoxylate/hydroxypyruvate reductase A [Halomonas zhuhanensis]MWJ28795.1 glyoxylate/hydroxypyruvate reductase A [Halomonas zhuhanensis]
MKILVHIDDAEAWRDALAERLPDAQVITSDAPAEQRRDMDYLAVWKPSEQLLREQTQLKGIINLGAGVDALLRNPGRPSDVPIVKLRDAGMGDLMVDYVLYGVLHFQRNFDRYRFQQQQAQWREIMVPDKADWPVGVLGLGAIGCKVATRLAEEGFPVIGWSRSPKQLDDVEAVHGDDGLNHLLENVKTLVTLLPDTAETRGLLDARRLAQLPEGASFINPGRGSLVDERALLDALGTPSSSGHLRGALLDVFQEEPLPQDSELWRHPNVIITPHMAAPTPLKEAVDQVADMIRRFEAGEPLDTVNRDAGY